MRPGSAVTALAVLAILLVAGPASQARPGDPGGTRGRLYEARSQLHYEKKRLDVVNEREQDLSRQLGQAQTDLQANRIGLEETVARLARAEDRLVTVRRQLQATRARLQESQAALERRLREIYMEGDVGYLVVLMGSDSFTDLLDHARYLSIILEADRTLLARVRKEKAELESQELALRSTVAEIRTLKATQEERVAHLTELESRRSRLLSEVRTQRRSISQYVVELEGTTRELEDRLRSTIAAEQATPGRAPKGTGRFIWPTNGPVVSEFGYRVHPIFGTLRMHTGLDIAAAGGTPIRATDNGIVIHSGWYGGYGNCIIIDHGGGYSTLYAHCSALYASYGQAVRQGQTVAAVGSTGYSTGPHLHFEVRVNGNPVNPRGFL